MPGAGVLLSLSPESLLLLSPSSPPELFAKEHNPLQALYSKIEGPSWAARRSVASSWTEKRTLACAAPSSKCSTIRLKATWSTR